MRFWLHATCAILWIAAFNPLPLRAQAELVRESLFPADLEFKELIGIQSQQELKGGIPAQALMELPLFEEAGPKKFAARTYALTNGGTLKIEIVDLIDKRAAFSLLTLLRKADMLKGPPGDFYVPDAGSLLFSQDGFWVKVSSDTAGDLLHRVAISISNRVGQRNSRPPTLVSHMPEKGLESPTLRYFLGPRAFQAHGLRLAKGSFKFGTEMELVQARYSVENQSGILSLISFPTGQLAEDFFNNASPLQSGESALKVQSYAKRAGPLVAILEGDFTPATADSLLGNIKFAYSIKWIYDKNNKSGQTIWGVPVGILGTVVRSLFLTALLCLGSLGAGIAMALFRVALRGYAPNNFLDRPERTELIRLKINEN